MCRCGCWHPNRPYASGRRTAWRVSLCSALAMVRRLARIWWRVFVAVGGPAVCVVHEYERRVSDGALVFGILAWCAVPPRLQPSRWGCGSAPFSAQGARYKRSVQCPRMDDRRPATGEESTASSCQWLGSARGQYCGSSAYSCIGVMPPPCHGAVQLSGPHTGVYRSTWWMLSIRVPRVAVYLWTERPESAGRPAGEAR